MILNQKCKAIRERIFPNCMGFDVSSTNCLGLPTHFFHVWDLDGFFVNLGRNKSKWIQPRMKFQPFEALECSISLYMFIHYPCKQAHHGNSFSAPCDSTSLDPTAHSSAPAHCHQPTLFWAFIWWNRSTFCLPWGTTISSNETQQSTTTKATKPLPQASTKSRYQPNSNSCACICWIFIQHLYVSRIHCSLANGCRCCTMRKLQSPTDTLSSIRVAKLLRRWNTHIIIYIYILYIYTIYILYILYIYTIYIYIIYTIYIYYIYTIYIYILYILYIYIYAVYVCRYSGTCGIMQNIRWNVREKLDFHRLFWQNPKESIRNSLAMPSDNSSLENLATSAQHRCKGASQLSIFFFFFILIDIIAYHNHFGCPQLDLW